MANTYKNAAVVLTSTGATDLYTAPSNTRSLVQSVNIANVDGSDRYATVTWYDASAGASYTLLYNGFLPAGTSMNALDTPCVLEPGDIIRVQASAANTLHATASIMEQDPTTPYVDGSITTVKIADDAVTADKLASNLSATTICTSGTRPASPFEGQTIYETDTDLEQRWTGSAWVVSGSNGGSFLSASSTTAVPAALTITYTQASITLTPGVWEVTSAMTLINNTTVDSAAVAIYNQTAAAVVSGSYGTPGYTSTTWASALQSMPTRMTVTSNTQVCPYGNRNGGSNIATAGGVGAPVGLITARRLYGG